MRRPVATRTGFEPLPVEVEFAREMAEALGRTGARLEECWTRALELRGALAGSRLRGEDPPPELLRAFREARREARRWRYYLIVHREAVGFRHHADVDRRYPLEALAEPEEGRGGRGA